MAAAEPAVEAAPESASIVFGDRLSLAQRYAGLLIGDGVVRGMIGPREPGRIWTRHLLNCAVVTELFEPAARVVDVGSGSGLPGIVMAIRRPDVQVELVEPALRRVTFLAEVVAALGLADQVRIVHGRAEEGAVVSSVGNAPWVTARAVAPLDRLVRWCLPLLAADGHLALMKGGSAAEELAEHGTAVGNAGGTNARIVYCGDGLVDPPVAVISLGVAPRVSRRVTRRGKRCASPMFHVKPTRPARTVFHVKQPQPGRASPRTFHVKHGTTMLARTKSAGPCSTHRLPARPPGPYRS
jgi:16S rRNA (guanine527-N7)-methyltransferase